MVEQRAVTFGLIVLRFVRTQPLPLDVGNVFQCYLRKLSEFQDCLRGDQTCLSLLKIWPSG